MSAPRIVLASTSRYRAELLHRIIPEFQPVAPQTDETPRPGETPHARALRLAVAKAHAVAAQRTSALVIGSDQVAALGKHILHKPGDMQTAHQQLRASSGNHVDFYTGLCVEDGPSGRQQTAVDHTRVHFRTLEDAEIERYLALEHPLDCAGSFKCEGAGIALFERIETGDPTALIGLPLIALARMLRSAGIRLP